MLLVLVLMQFFPNPWQRQLPYAMKKPQDGGPGACDN
jgi:hypothetical protein